MRQIGMADRQLLGWVNEDLLASPTTLLSSPYVSSPMEQTDTPGMWVAWLLIDSSWVSS